MRDNKETLNIKNRLKGRYIVWELRFKLKGFEVLTDVGALKGVEVSAQVKELKALEIGLEWLLKAVEVLKSKS